MLERLDTAERGLATIQRRFDHDPVLSATAAGRMPLLAPRYLISELPATPEEGTQAYATDSAKRNETLGVGTGTPVYPDVVGVVVTWRRLSDDLEVGTSRKLDLGEFVALTVTGAVTLTGDLTFVKGHIETYISSPAATSITNTSDFFQVAGTFTNSVPGEGFTVTSAGQITYTASRTRMLHTYASWGLEAAANNQIIEMGMRKNGTIITASIIRRKIAVAGDIGSSALHSMFTVATGDTLDVAVRNTSGTANITVDNLNIGVLALPNDMTGVTVP